MTMKLGIAVASNVVCSRLSDIIYPAFSFFLLFIFPPTPSLVACRHLVSSQNAPYTRLARAALCLYLSPHPPSLPCDWLEVAVGVAYSGCYVCDLHNLCTTGIHISVKYICGVQAETRGIPPPLLPPRLFRAHSFLKLLRTTNLHSRLLV